MAEALRYDGIPADELGDLLGVPCVDLLDSARSTMDVAHRLGREGAPAGTLALADSQTEGRGRGGAAWISEAGRGIWMTLLERPRDPSALDVLSLRIGMAAARAVDRFAPEPIRIKWPNDLYLGEAKLAGILIEARWRELGLDWVAIGIGINVSAPRGIGGGSLEQGTRRVDVLSELLPELRAAAGATGQLTAEEMAEFEGRDYARGRPCTEPAIGTVQGITNAGELIVTLADSVGRFRSGSLVLDEKPRPAPQPGAHGAANSPMIPPSFYGRHR